MHYVTRATVIVHKYWTLISLRFSWKAGGGGGGGWVVVRLFHSTTNKLNLEGLSLSSSVIIILENMI